MRDTVNDYPFPVLDSDEVPENPHPVYPEDLEQSLEKVLPNGVDVDVSERFTRRVAEVKKHRTGRVEEVRVSWQVYQDETYSDGADGWTVLMSALKDLEAI